VRGRGGEERKGAREGSPPIHIPGYATAGQMAVVVVIKGRQLHHKSLNMAARGRDCTIPGGPEIT